MRISDCVALLQRLLAEHGDIECEADCPYCGRSFFVGRLVIAPETVQLQTAEKRP